MLCNNTIVISFAGVLFFRYCTQGCCWCCYCDNTSRCTSTPPLLCFAFSRQWKWKFLHGREHDNWCLICKSRDDASLWALQSLLILLHPMVRCYLIEQLNWYLIANVITRHRWERVFRQKDLRSLSRTPYRPHSYHSLGCVRHIPPRAQVLECHPCRWSACDRWIIAGIPHPRSSGTLSSQWYRSWHVPWVATKDNNYINELHSRRSSQWIGESLHALTPFCAGIWPCPVETSHIIRRILASGVWAHHWCSWGIHWGRGTYLARKWYSLGCRVRWSFGYTIYFVHTTGQDIWHCHCWTDCGESTRSSSSPLHSRLCWVSLTSVYVLEVWVTAVSDRHQWDLHHQDNAGRLDRLRRISELWSI